MSIARVGASAAAALTFAGMAASADMQGFTAASALREASLEQRYDGYIKPDDMREWMQQLAAAPNHVGSPHDKANAEFIAQKFREWGWQTRIESFSVLYPTPLQVSLELIAPTHVTARLSEPPVEGDPVTTQVSAELPPYNVYGADGDVTGELVYVNQGMPEDYRELARMGIDVKGRIVLTRYGGGWRGLKPKLAYEHGAIGCVIYSDPHDDGYAVGQAYPAGGYRPRDAVQRGSVQDMTLYSGDPLTPGVASLPGAKRLAIADAATVLKIPVLPISYGDAEPLLLALQGRTAPAAWRGALPLTYRIGPGPAQVHLKIKSDWSQKTVYDVIATLRGAEQPDRWILRGNHHDAWVFGGSDPFSGHVAMMAEAQALGRLVHSGWRPRRTIVYTSWDAEEPGLLGSTEWVEAHADELKAKAVLYVNSDMNGRGVLAADGSHALRTFLGQVATDVRDPERSASVAARALAVERVNRYETHKHIDEGDDLPMGYLGSGSDFSPFLQHLGIDSVNIEFAGETDYGVYHSAYDTYEHYNRFVDPGFLFAATLAQTVGRVVLRAADADVVPKNQTDFAKSMVELVDELHVLDADTRANDSMVQRLGVWNAFSLAENSRALHAAPAAFGAAPPLDFSALDESVQTLTTRAAAFDAAYERALLLTGARGVGTRARLDATLSNIETTLTDPRGLPGRPWFQHMLYAPGAYTGYGVKTLPGVREAIEEHQWSTAQEYIGVVARVLDAYSTRLAAASGG